MGTVLLKRHIGLLLSLCSGVDSFHVCFPATQNVLKYTQTHREIEVLADTSYCFNVYALAIINNTLLTSSCTLHSRKFLR